jgi:hypothetical protein
MTNSKQEGLFMKYFVLSPTKKSPYGTASRVALLAYASTIRSTNPILAQHLTLWIDRIEAGLGITGGK